MAGLPAFGTTLVASASVLSPTRRNDPAYDTVQGQLWDYYARLEEFSAAVSWKGNALSRVRLIAAEYIPAVNPSRSPSPKGQRRCRCAPRRWHRWSVAVACELMGVHYNVPGEGWLVGSPRKTARRSGRSTLPMNSASTADEYQLKYRRTARGRGNRSAAMSWWSGSGVLMSGTPTAPGRSPPTRSARWAELDLINKRIIAETDLAPRVERSSFCTTRIACRTPSWRTPRAWKVPTRSRRSWWKIAFAGHQGPQSAEAALKMMVGVRLGDATDVKLEDVMHVIDLSNPIDDKLIPQRESRDSASRDRARPPLGRSC